MNPLRRLLHRLAHRLHWQLGRVVSATDSRGRVWVGFECATCGQVTGASIALGEPRMSESQTAPARAPVFRCAACGAIWRTPEQRARCCTATTWAERISRDDTACLLDEARRTTIMEMREAVEAISMASGDPAEQRGLRWAQARMLHALAEMEAAVP